MQVNWDNLILIGFLWLKWLGCIWLEYDELDVGLMMVFGGSFVIFDKKFNQLLECYLVWCIFLWLLLECNVDLMDQKMVVGYGFDGSYIYVEVMDLKCLEYGLIQLWFILNLIIFKGWVIFDVYGGNMMVVFDDFNEDVEIDNQMFNIFKMIDELVFEENC